MTGSEPRERREGAPWLVLPTYNEAENIEAIVTAAAAVLERATADGDGAPVHAMASDRRPAEQAAAPVAGSSTLAEQAAMPVAGSSTLAEQAAMPVAGSSTLAEQAAMPVAGSSTLAEQAAMPVAGSSTLAEQAAMPVAGSSAYRILIVDDSSPDGTGEIADRLAAEREQVEVLHRSEKNGIGPAYLAGFRHALDHGAGYVMEMDSDFSHDPSDLERLLRAVRTGADLALGSRYVPGGAITDWRRLRRLVSRGGSSYARLVLGLRVRDLTGGFKCFRREVLEGIHFDSVRSQGYAFQVELTYRAACAGFRIVEVPIVFKDRERGQSKMSWRIAAEAMWLVPRLRFGRRPPPVQVESAAVR